MKSYFMTHTPRKHCSSLFKTYLQPKPTFLLQVSICVNQSHHRKLLDYLKNQRARGACGRTSVQGKESPCKPSLLSFPSSACRCNKAYKGTSVREAQGPFCLILSVHTWPLHLHSRCLFPLLLFHLSLDVPPTPIVFRLQ